MAEPVKVTKIEDEILRIQKLVEDAAIDGEYHKADALSEELQDLEERKAFGEIYLINI